MPATMKPRHHALDDIVAPEFPTTGACGSDPTSCAAARRLRRRLATTASPSLSFCDRACRCGLAPLRARRPESPWARRCGGCLLVGRDRRVGGELSCVSASRSPHQKFGRGASSVHRDHRDRCACQSRRVPSGHIGATGRKDRRQDQRGQQHPTKPLASLRLAAVALNPVRERHNARSDHPHRTPAAMAHRRRRRRPQSIRRRLRRPWSGHERAEAPCFLVVTARCLYRKVIAPPPACGSEGRAHWGRTLRNSGQSSRWRCRCNQVLIPGHRRAHRVTPL